MPADTQSTTLAYGEHAIEAIHHDGLTWLRAPHLAAPLGLADGARVREIYTRNADEFGPRETRELPLPTPGGVQKVRVFSLHGARLLAMLASTPEAKRFRRWVLDLLQRMDGETPVVPVQAELSPTEAAFFAMMERRIAQLQRTTATIDRRYIPHIVRLQQLNEQIAGLNVDKRDVYALCRSQGLDVQELRFLVEGIGSIVTGPVFPMRRKGLSHG